MCDRCNTYIHLSTSRFLCDLVFMRACLLTRYRTTVLHFYCFVVPLLYRFTTLQFCCPIILLLYSYTAVQLTLLLCNSTLLLHHYFTVLLSFATSLPNNTTALQFYYHLTLLIFLDLLYLALAFPRCLFLT